MAIVENVMIQGNNGLGLKFIIYDGEQEIRPLESDYELIGLQRTNPYYLIKDDSTGQMLDLHGAWLRYHNLRSSMLSPGMRKYG